MVMSNPTDELIRQLDSVRRYNSKQLEILKELEDNYFEAIKSLKWALSIIRPIQTQWTEETDDKGTTRNADDFIQQLSIAEEVIAKADNDNEKPS